MDQIIQEFLAWPQYQIIDQLAAEGKTETLYELGMALEAHAEEFQSKIWAVESVYDHLEHVLALTPGMNYAHTLMKLLLLPRTRTMQFPCSLNQRSRWMAPLLASAQSTDVLLDLISIYRYNHACTEFICILVQEMVLRGIPCDEIPLLMDFFDQMRALHHPLAWLPLRLLDIEMGLPLPTYFIGGSGFSSPEIEWAPVSEQKAAPSPEGELSVTLTECTTDSERERIEAAVDPWSNADMEARVFALDHSMTSLQVSGSLFMSMQLACLKGVSAHDIALGSLSPQNAFRQLFAAASQGGAYDHGHHGAYGRLATWYSLAGLVGAPTSASVKEVATLTEQGNWFAFAAESDWFYGAAPMWDLSILALRSDGKSLAVLAATSTD